MQQQPVSTAFGLSPIHGTWHSGDHDVVWHPRSCALPFLFVSLKIAAPAAVITAFVSEYFGGSQNGLGSRISSNIANSKNAAAWAYVLAACLLGLLFYLFSVVMESLNRKGEAK